MSELAVGDPLDEGTYIGPLTTESGRDELAGLVDDARVKGAEMLVGGTVPERTGWFFPPTVVAGVTPAMRFYAEEAFGPVATVSRVTDAKQAVWLADVTTFGLSAAVWTNDPAEEDLLVRSLAAGGGFVNGMTVSYPELPFGGVKDSGVGRELAAAGIREFCNPKTVWKG